MTARPTGIYRWLFRLPIYVYRCRCGSLLGRRFVLLHHIGRRTGLPRETVLEVLQYREPAPEIIVMSGFGRNAEWLRNIEAVPRVEVEIGRRRFSASYRLLPPDEAVRVLTAYEQRNRFAGPVIRWVLSRLVGWRYHASDADRGKLVRELPLVAFRPRP